MERNLVVFINSDLLKHEEKSTALRSYLLNDPPIERYSKIEDVADGYVLVSPPPSAFKEAHQNDSGLCAHDYDTVYAGFFKTTVQTLIKFLG